MNNYFLKISCTDVKNISHEEIDNIKKTMIKYPLLIIKNQCLADNDLLNIAKKVGNGNLEESARNISLTKSRRNIAYLSNIKSSDGGPIGYAGSTTDYWHSDQEFRINPASITILYCVIPSETGGSTSFASTSIKHLEINKDYIEKIKHLWSTRVPADNHDNAPKITVSHPVFLNNNDDPSIYVSENTINFLDNNNSVEDSPAIKKYLMNKILTEKNIYSHQWNIGDLLIFDNSKLIHRREAFSGIRFLKGMKIYPDSNYHTKINGFEI
jgi:taurine dioxygenase